MSTFRLPDLGEGLQEAEIVDWHVAPGQEVKADQPLVSVETAKAVVEIPSPQSGRILHLHGEPGEMVEVGSPLVEFADAGTDRAAIVGELPSADVASEAQPRAAAAAARAAEAGAPVAKASPAVRARARELGIDLAKIKGTGPGGAISMRDLEEAKPQPAEAGGELRSARRTMARNMAKAHAEVAPASVTEEANVSGWRAGEDITVRLIRAIAAGVKAEPRLNAWYDGARDALTVHETISLGIAQDTPEGLFVPVLRGIEERSDQELRSELERLKTAVAERLAEPRDLTGQTITLSNFGSIAGIHAVLVVMPPQVAILGAGRIVSRPVVADGEVRAGRILPLSLTIDHRAVTGGEASRFLKAVVRSLEST
jgi:pyruvate dehydrogenase E2 component (dihydrolipoamide acetyltransferase)